MKQSICRLLVTAVVVLFSATTVYAETRYVTDKMQITFRTGPGNDRKIISLLNSGQPVSFLQPEGEWAKVSLQNGKEGWVLQQYLSAEVPCRIRIKEVDQTLERSNAELETVKKNNQQLESDKRQLSTDLKNLRRDLANTKKSFAKLKKDAAGFLELKTRHDKTIERLSMQTQKADALDKELTNTLKKRNIRWFLGGAGVLLMGFIMGFGSKRQKRQSSLL